MDKIAGLKEYVALRSYREALGLPEKVTEHYQLLAQGEYNRNYLFVHPYTGRKLVLRVNCGSQMHLPDQIGYEYSTLKLLEHSARTPVPCYVDGSLEKLPHGIMVMEFLPGHALDYRTELLRGAGCLADIHSIAVKEDSHLLRPKEPLRAILSECEEMVGTYMDSALGDIKIKRKIRAMLNKGWKICERRELKSSYECCVNTELNSTNFLINGEGKQNYLIDWEKPVYGDPAQDLGHFLAPTTTFWKTDVILKPEEREAFLKYYIRSVDGRFDTEGIVERTKAFIPITCLRGITWCAMAFVEYQQPGRLLMNPSTMKKLSQYLDEDFLEEREIEAG